MDQVQREDHETPLTEEEARELIPSLSTRAELNEAERANILMARRWAMHPRTLSREDLVTDGFGRELHRRMFNQIWQWAGTYRKSERNLGWEVPRITEGVYHAFADARAWLLHDTYPLHESAVRLHHRLVCVHPWPNGNGRHARLMADVFVRAGGGSELTWGAGALLADPSAVRTRYIECLRRADDGDVASLLRFARG